MKKTILLPIILSICVALSSCTSEPKTDSTENTYISYEQLVQNMENPRKLPKLKSSLSISDATLLHTVSQITLFDKGDEQLIKECYSLINYYENILSANVNKKDTSEIYALNENEGKPYTLSNEALECFIYGYEYSVDSQDTFDITIGKLSKLWDFENAEVAPNDSDIQKAVETVDYNNVFIDGNTVTIKNPNTSIDLGGIAKGFIADKVTEYLKSQGVESAIINLGGNVYALGYKDNSTKLPYKVAIRKPVETLEIEQLGYVEVHDMSIVSSGSYEQFFIDKNTGTKYSHILDKFTGYPVETDLAQASIFTEKSADGDGLSTTVYSLGAVEGLKLIESLENTECILVTKQGEIILSSGVKEDDTGKIKFVKQ